MCFLFPIENLHTQKSISLKETSCVVVLNIMSALTSKFVAFPYTLAYTLTKNNMPVIFGSRGIKNRE